MGIGDRHSKRNAATKTPTLGSQVQRPYVVDDRELDDAFSAWDEDDALARKPGYSSEVPQLAQATTSSLAQTRIERKSAGGTAPTAGVPDALVDPVAMRDIVISRARTLDDPLTTRVLAEIARSEVPGDRAQHPQRGRLHVRTVKLPSFLLPAAGTRAHERKPETLAISPEPEPEPSDAPDEIDASRRRTTRRSIDPKK